MRASWVAAVVITAFVGGPAVAKPKAPAVAIQQADYRVAADDVSGEARRYVAVVLPGRVIEAELTRIADQVRNKEKVPFERTLVNFYLPSMKIGQGAWATAAFNPNLKISIIGLRLDEEQSALAEAAIDKRNIIGSWLTQSPSAPGRLTLYREQAKTFAEWRLRDGKRIVEEQLESKVRAGRRFDPVSGGTAHYIVTWSGELELRDAEVLIASAERLPTVVGGAERPAAPLTRTAAVRSRPANTKSASSDASAKLSEQLFKF